MHLFTHTTALALLLCLLTGCASTHSAHSASEQPKTTATMTTTPPVSSPRLGNFSVSLAVKDLATSRAFYEKLGLRVVGGDAKKNWLVLQNETAIIGIFQGMFDKNMMTFNPGWDRNRATPPDFDDVRDIQRTLKSRGIALTAEADEATTGPAYIMLTDPDGNPILIDQHVPRGK